MNDDTDRDDQSGPGTPAKESTLSLDAVLEVLANRRRRYALYALADLPDGVVSLDALVEEVATLVAARDGVALTRDQYQDIAIELYHWHLPVLADVGVVDCDVRHDTIRYRSHPVLETWVARTRRDELP